MSEETLLVFKMLQDGKLTPEQAEALLKAIPVEERKGPPSAAPAAEVESEGFEAVQRKLTELQAKLAELQHNVGSAQSGVFDRLKSQIGDLNFKPILDDATRTLGSVKTEVVRTAKLAARVAERQTRKLRAEAKHAGRKFIDECRMELAQGSRPVNIHGVAESVDVATSSAPVSAGTHLDIVNPLGNIRMVKSAKAVVTVKATKTAWSASSEVRQSRLDSVRIAGPEHESGLTGSSIYVVPDSTDLRDVTVDLEVAVPSGVRIGAEAGFGDIALDGISAIIGRIESLSGSVLVKDVKHTSEHDAARMRVRAGALEVTDFQGGALDAASASGRVQLTNLNVAALKARTAGGDVVVSQAKTSGPVSIYAASGKISLANVETPASVLVSVTSGDVTAADIDSGSLDLRTISGDIEVNRVDTTADKLAMATVSGDIKAQEVLSDAVTIGTISGDATLHFSDPVIRSLGASTVSGDITVTLTGETGAKVELRTQSGKLACDVPLTASTEQTGHRTLSGVIGDGKGSIKMQSVSGDLRIGQ